MNIYKIMFFQEGYFFDKNNYLTIIEFKFSYNTVNFIK